MADATKDVQAALEKEVEALKKELAEITKALSLSASEAKDRAEDAVDDLRGRASKVARSVRKEAHDIVDTARENPKTTAAVGGSAGLVGFILGTAIGALVVSCSRR